MQIVKYNIIGTTTILMIVLGLLYIWGHIPYCGSNSPNTLGQFEDMMAAVKISVQKCSSILIIRPKRKSVTTRVIAALLAER